MNHRINVDKALAMPVRGGTVLQDTLEELSRSRNNEAAFELAWMRTFVLARDVFMERNRLRAELTRLKREHDELRAECESLKRRVTDGEAVR